MPTSQEELRASLEGHNAEFEALLRLIPAKYYLVPEDSAEFTSKYQKNSKKQKAPKQAIKEASKKAKRDKLDPANNKTIVELQEEAALKKAVAASKTKGKARDVSEREEDEESGSEIEDLEVDMDQMDVFDERGHEPSEEETLVEFKPMDAPASIESLRAKLRARMEELRQKNGRRNASGDPGSKDELLEERRRQRAAMRERRRKETKEKKRKEEEERKKKGKEKEKQQTGGQTTKPQLLVPDVSGRPSTSDPYSKLTNVAFSTLAGTSPSAPKSLKTASNPSQALAQLSKRAEQRASLPEEKRKELEERDIWAKAAARVTGAKVHDNPARLAKAAKRREKEKAKSKKEWEVRKEEVAKAQTARQKKRTDNIAMRHEKRKGKKDSKRRPGFEGKGFGGGAKKAGKPKGRK